VAAYHAPCARTVSACSVALSTPFTEDRAIDLPRLVAHARQSLADGCTGVTAFGTTARAPRSA